MLLYYNFCREPVRTFNEDHPYEQPVLSNKPKLSFFWMNHDIHAPSSTTEKPKRKKNKKKNKIKDRPKSRPKEHKFQFQDPPPPREASITDLWQTSTKPPQTQNPKKKPQPFGWEDIARFFSDLNPIDHFRNFRYFSFSMGNSDDVNIFLGLPGSQGIDDEKLKEFADVVKANEWP